MLAVAESRDKFNKIERPLEHFHYDTFQVPPKEFDQFARFKLSFVTNSEGDIDRLRANLDANVEEINFTRVAEPAMFEKPFLRRFSGEYENTPKPLIVTLQGTSQLLLGGTKLLPLYGTRFRLDGQTGVSVEFRGDASGRVTEMVTYSPAGAFVRRKN